MVDTEPQPVYLTTFLCQVIPWSTTWLVDYLYPYDGSFQLPSKGPMQFDVYQQVRVSIDGSRADKSR